MILFLIIFYLNLTNTFAQDVDSIGINILEEFEEEDGIVRDAFWSRIMNSDSKDRFKIGVALSGGGARGFVHVGVLEALEHAGFPIDCVSGTSMGSVIGALYSSGMSVEKIWEFGTKISSLKVSRDFGGLKFINLLISDKLISPTYITQFLENNLKDVTFENMSVPFACVAMDFKTGERIIFRDGPVSIAVRSSVNLPGIFVPVEYRHRYLVDGGVVDFIPIDAARILGGQWIIASVAEGGPMELPQNVFLSLLQVIDIRGSLLAKDAQKKAHFVIRPDVGEIKVADFEKCLQAGEIGLIEASRRINDAKESLIVFSIEKILEKIQGKGDK